MKRIKVQRGYLAQNPYKRAKFYDQGFENVRNPPRTPHLQTYGKKYDLMKLLQVVTALMQLRKNEVNKSPVVQFKEGIKRNMERIKPAIASGAAEQYYLGKPALDSLYKKTVDEIRGMLISRPTGARGMSELKKLVKETDDERQKAYQNSGKYVIVADLVKDLVKQYKGKKELGLLASHLNDDLKTFKDDVIGLINKQKINDDEKAKQIFALEREIREFFNPENLDANASIVDNSGLKALYPIMRKKALAVPSNISSANAILDDVEDDVTSDRNWEAINIFYEPDLKHKRLYEKLTGLAPRMRELILTERFVDENPNFEVEFDRAKLRKDDAESAVTLRPQGDKAALEQARRARKDYNRLLDDFNRYLFGKNKTSSVAMMPGESGSMDSNITLAPIVLASLPESALPPPPMPLPP